MISFQIIFKEFLRLLQGGKYFYLLVSIDSICQFEALGNGEKEIN